MRLKIVTGVKSFSKPEQPQPKKSKFLSALMKKLFENEYFSQQYASAFINFNRIIIKDLRLQLNWKMNVIDKSQYFQSRLLYLINDVASVQCVNVFRHGKKYSDYRIVDDRVRNYLLLSLRF